MYVILKNKKSLGGWGFPWFTDKPWSKNYVYPIVTCRAFKVPVHWDTLAKNQEPLA
jgi:hypothetical protein